MTTLIIEIITYIQNNVSDLPKYWFLVPLTLSGVFLIICNFFKNDKKITELNIIKNNSRNQEFDYLDSVLDSIEADSIRVIRSLIEKEATVDKIVYIDVLDLLAQHNKLLIEHQVLNYKYVWVENKINLRRLFAIMINRDSLHDKIGAVLDEYILLNTDDLIGESRKVMKSHMDSYPYLSNYTSDDRYSKDRAFMVMSKAIKQCVKLETTMNNKMKRKAKEYNIMHKVISIMRSIIKNENKKD